MRFYTLVLILAITSAVLIGSSECSRLKQMWASAVQWGSNRGNNQPAAVDPESEKKKSNQQLMQKETTSQHSTTSTTTSQTQQPAVRTIPTACSPLSLLNTACVQELVLGTCQNRALMRHAERVHLLGKIKTQDTNGNTQFVYIMSEHHPTFHQVMQQTANALDGAFSRHVDSNTGAEWYGWHCPVFRHGEAPTPQLSTLENAKDMYFHMQYAQKQKYVEIMFAYDPNNPAQLVHEIH